MKYKLINDINLNYDAIEQILVNRGIQYNDIGHYLNTTDEDINDFKLLGETQLKAAAAALITHIKNNSDMLIVVDCDCDGFTSSALLINYLHDVFPAYTENKIKWYLHEGKIHGLEDVMDYIENMNFDIIICPDASSNDYIYHKQLHDMGKDIIVLDHHEAEHISEDAIIINNQLSDYPNKQMSGVGITWQFCRYLDNLLNSNYAENYYDLVALGNCGDMMDLRSIETKHLILKGFKDEYLKNPFIYYMAQKNAFSLRQPYNTNGSSLLYCTFC